jgi:WS/DGAT/MGAT family acyltransferase
MRTATRERPERLSVLDVSNLKVEQRGLPMHVAALALLDAGPLLDASGELRLGAVREHVEGRTRRTPRLRQVLAPADHRSGRLVWVDAPGFDVAQHVRTRRVPEPGDEAALLALCCELNRPSLDRSRPLWEMWLLTGLAGGRVAMLLRVHHVVADGLALVRLLGNLFDATGGGPAGGGPAGGGPAASTPPPGSHPWPPARVWSVVRSWTGMAADVARNAGAPAVSLNRPVGERRTLRLVRADLEAARAVAHRHGGRVNDVVLAAVAGGAGRLLGSRGELAPGLVLKVSVATNLRRPGDTADSGNRVGVRLVPIPVAEPVAGVRLDTVAAFMRAERGRPPYQPSGRMLRGWTVRVMSRQRIINLLESNLPGPTVPLAFGGAAVRELFQVGTVQGNVALAVGVVSYAGQLNLTVVADADVVPDVALFADGARDALRDLGVPAGRR